MNFKDFLLLSEQYIYSSNTLIEKILESNNNNCIISKRKISIRKLEKSTKYNDAHLLVPALWSSYHGIELLIKGLLLIKKNSIQYNHKTNINFEDFKKTYPNRKKLIDLLDNFVNNSYTILGNYVKDNNLTCSNINEIYESLRYPYNHSGKSYDYGSLKYNGKKIFSGLKEILIINISIIHESIKLYHFYDK